MRESYKYSDLRAAIGQVAKGWQAVAEEISLWETAASSHLMQQLNNRSLLCPLFLTVVGMG